MRYVYILKGEKKHYIGMTNNLERRLKEHTYGKTRTTKAMGSFICLGYFIKNTKEEAEKLEKIMKKNGHIQHRIHHPTFVHYSI